MDGAGATARGRIWPCTPALTSASASSVYTDRNESVHSWRGVGTGAGQGESRTPHSHRAPVSRLQTVTRVRSLWRAFREPAMSVSSHRARTWLICAFRVSDRSLFERV